LWRASASVIYELSAQALGATRQLREAIAEFRKAIEDLSGHSSVFDSNLAYGLYAVSGRQGRRRQGSPRTWPHNGDTYPSAQANNRASFMSASAIANAAPRLARQSL